MNLSKLQATVIGLGLLLFGTTTVVAAEYDHEITERDMTFAWKVDGDKLAVKVSAETEGWVGVGFNPSEQMKDGNIIIGYVKDGKVKIIDQFGERSTAHAPDRKLKGSDDVTEVGGTEEGGVTTLEFVIPLDSGDKYDTVIDVGGDTKVMLAYGGGRDSFHSRHKYRDTIVVNLSTGEVQK